MAYNVNIVTIVNYTAGRIIYDPSIIPITNTIILSKFMLLVKTEANLAYGRSINYHHKILCKSKHAFTFANHPSRSANMFSAQFFTDVFATIFCQMSVRLNSNYDREESEVFSFFFSRTKNMFGCKCRSSCVCPRTDLQNPSESIFFHLVNLNVHSHNQLDSTKVMDSIVFTAFILRQT